MTDRAEIIERARRLVEAYMRAATERARHNFRSAGIAEDAVQEILNADGVNIARALLDLAAEHEWRTMDSAPKDGTWIAVWTRSDGYVPWVHWDDGEWVSGFIQWRGRPTHWQHLPKGPTP